MSVVLAILDNQTVFIHGHSVKRIKRVVHRYENGNETSRDLDVKEDETRSGVNQNQLCFAHIFLILDTLYYC